ncbi:MAG: AAA family ATPase [Candidatus Pseudobacter hemicellulosilyticus]|uniref:AAA family ATPase n=1 Tax=Candidatus Pseudobacter hemicellulosilyticus TaxID=3121375 RepID=A0AAJ6BHH9_9BACT|nr:MAG: AAA family ATPase [Pseudobacter sp.]
MPEGVYFSYLQLNGAFCFDQEARIDFTDAGGKWKRWTVILGDNGTGKTTLLKTLAGFEMAASSLGDNKIGYSPIGFVNVDSNIDIIDSHTEVNVGLIGPGLSQDDSATLVIAAYENIGMSIHQNPEYSQLQCYGYGATRRMSQTAVGDSIGHSSQTLYDESTALINAEEWLLLLDYSSRVDSDVKQYAQRKKAQVEQLLIELLPDVVEISFLPPTKESMVPKLKCRTHFGWCSVHNLSLGYKTMIAWLVDFAYRMFERYPNAANPLAEPAIVLIDEIDLHLHPKWQRTIFDCLAKNFPKTQFIVTAHSPLIVQATPADANLILLRKKVDHVEVDQDIRNVHSWRIDQILSSELFDIPSRNEDIERQMERRRVLVLKDALTIEEQAELAALDKFLQSMPYAESRTDIEARDIIRRAAEHYKNIGLTNDPDNG